MQARISRPGARARARGAGAGAAPAHASSIRLVPPKPLFLSVFVKSIQMAASRQYLGLVASARVHQTPHPNFGNRGLKTTIPALPKRHPYRSLPGAVSSTFLAHLTASSAPAKTRSRISHFVALQRNPMRLIQYDWTLLHFCTVPHAAPPVKPTASSLICFN